MVTPPKLPETHRQPPSPRVVVPTVILLAALGVAAMLFLPQLGSEAATSEPVQEPALTSANAGELCLQLSENPKEYLSGEASQRRRSGSHVSL